MSEPEESKVPGHVAIIMDGNRRWAKEQGLSAVAGHDYVVENLLEPIVERSIELGIGYITFWAFSTENWQRNKREVKGMMGIFRKGLKRSAEKLFEKGVKLRILGDIDKFPRDIARQAKEWVVKSKSNQAITVNIALNYGGRDELLRAIRRILSAQLRNPALRKLLIQPLHKPVASSGDKLDDLILSNLSKLVNEVEIEKYLDTKGIPDPDLIIRTGGEKRLSGFMSWQSAYSELYFTDVLMPNFTIKEFDKAIVDFHLRRRRFGK